MASCSSIGLSTDQKEFLYAPPDISDEVEIEEKEESNKGRKKA